MKETLEILNIIKLIRNKDTYGLFLSITAYVVLFILLYAAQPIWKHIFYKVTYSERLYEKVQVTNKKYYTIITYTAAKVPIVAHYYKTTFKNDNYLTTIDNKEIYNKVKKLQFVRIGFKKEFWENRFTSEKKEVKNNVDLKIE